jgi:AcrR family transcriptional regulator
VPFALPLDRTYHKRITHSTYSPAVERPLRRDARENRDRILVAARTTFTELGMDASVEEIARRAGVGMGTLYRRFPTKDTLIDAVFEEHLDHIAAIAEDALGEPDAWAAFLGYLSQIVELQVTDRGLSEILGSRLRTERLVSRARTRLRPLVEQLIERAQATGGLRPDVVFEDVSVLLWTTGRVVDATRDVQPSFWQRYLALLVDGLRAGSAGPLPRPPLTADEHRRAMTHFAGHRARSARP